MPIRSLVILVLVLLVAVGAYVYFTNGQVTIPSTYEVDANGLVTLALGETGSAGVLTLTPRTVEEDSRCPEDVQCIQAGRARLNVAFVSPAGTTQTVLEVGEPVQVGDYSITLTAVAPAKNSKVQISDSDYRFTFKVLAHALTYQNASADLISVTLPYPGAVTGRDFSVKGQARGSWYFEASFPVKVLDPQGAVLATGVAQAQGDWMTSDFVPFTANLSVPASYSGPGTLVFTKDNPSGDPSRDASLSFPITIAE